MSLTSIVDLFLETSLEAVEQLIRVVMGNVRVIVNETVGHDSGWDSSNGGYKGGTGGWSKVVNFVGDMNVDRASFGSLMEIVAQSLRNTLQWTTIWSIWDGPDEWIMYGKVVRFFIFTHIFIVVSYI